MLISLRALRVFFMAAFIHTATYVDDISAIRRRAEEGIVGLG